MGRRLRRGQLVGVDAVVVAVYALALLATGPAVAVTGPGVTTPPAPAAQPDVPWLQLALAAAALIPLAFRRLAPLPVYLAVLGVSVTAVAFDVLWDPLLPAAFALYTVAVAGTPRRWWQRRLPALSIGALTVAGAIGASRDLGLPWFLSGAGMLLLGFGALLAAWELGRSARLRREYAVRAAQRLARQAAADERLRIARELHDIVTHSMGLIAVKAGVANHVVRSRPEEAHDALRVIERTSRAALDDMRRMLGVLRTPEAEAAQLTPTPGPQALTALAAQTGASLTATGLEDLPEGVGLAVYRIVQEALTNVAKHAGPGARSAVTAEADGREVRIRVTDDGRGVPGDAAYADGHGLTGMRERVALYGGTVTAGPRSGGGFAVHAALPYESAR
ncbi:MAG: sensor histidine kinase [Hamadaea sp.]|nr:sensor histidine kinase [Hamadaea sp.]